MSARGRARALLDDAVCMEKDVAEGGMLVWTSAGLAVEAEFEDCVLAAVVVFAIMVARVNEDE